MSYFLKMIGTASDPLPTDWIQTRPEVLRGVRFGKKPPTHKGDMLIYYAVGSQRLVGLFEVISEKPAKENPPSEPWTAAQKYMWPWWVGLKMIAQLPADERAPHARDVDFDVTRVIHQGLVALSVIEFRKMEDAVREAERRLSR
jgi:hypothetical protein